jgi:predicted SprT family Zn-dependent metalloprotease
MILPSLKERRLMDRHLTFFFREYKPSDFKKAISYLSRFYHMKAPQVDWFEYLDWGKTAGKTYQNGKIHLVHPENWKNGRKYNSERKWINTVYHEFAHYIFWADAEQKADNFAFRMVRGLNNHK